MFSGSMADAANRCRRFKFRSNTFFEIRITSIKVDEQFTRKHSWGRVIVPSS